MSAQKIDGVTGKRTAPAQQTQKRGVIIGAMKTIRGGRGLGDALYIRPIADHFLRRGEQVKVLCSYPGVFTGTAAVVEPFMRVRTDVVAHYVDGKRNPSTTMWQDVCACAGVSADMRINWTVQNQRLIADLRAKAAGRRIVVVVGGRRPMDRADGFGIELLPKQQAFDAALGMLSDCLLVQVGKNEQLYPLKTEVNLNGKTSITDLMDIGAVCDGVVGQCSFAVPLAEVFDKPFLLLWGARVSASPHPFIAVMTPQKVMSGRNDLCVVDDAAPETMAAKVAEFKALFS